MDYDIRTLITPYTPHIQRLAEQLKTPEEIITYLRSLNLQVQDSWYSAEELLEQLESNQDTILDCNDTSIIAVSALLAQGNRDAKVYIGYVPSMKINHAVVLIGDEYTDITCLKCSPEELFSNPIVIFNDKEIEVYSEEGYRLL